MLRLASSDVEDVAASTHAASTSGIVKLRMTIAFSSPGEPPQPLEYTRVTMVPTFRPHSMASRQGPQASGHPRFRRHAASYALLRSCITGAMSTLTGQIRGRDGMQGRSPVGCAQTSEPVRRTTCRSMTRSANSKPSEWPISWSRSVTSRPDQDFTKNFRGDSATVAEFNGRNPCGARVSVARPEGLEPPTS